jgi:hypothetical protein
VSVVLTQIRAGERVTVVGLRGRQRSTTVNHAWAVMVDGEIAGTTTRVLQDGHLLWATGGDTFTQKSDAVADVISRRSHGVSVTK